MYLYLNIYIWITLLYVWNLYSFVIQLYFNKNFLKIKQSIEKEELIIFLINYCESPAFYLYGSFFSSHIGNVANLFFDQVFGIWVFHPRECWQLPSNLCFLACISVGSVCCIYYCDVSLGRGRGVEHRLKVCSSKNYKYKQKNRTMWVTVQRWLCEKTIVLGL